MGRQRHRKWMVRKGTAAALALLLILQIAAPFIVHTQAATDYVVLITGSPVNVRSGAGTGNTKIGTTNNGSVYTYLGEGKDRSGTVWYKIQYTSSTVGWVTSQYSIKTSYSPDYAQTYINTVASYYGAAGVQVAVIENGVVTGTYNYGWATKDSTPMTSDAKIRVASVSKVAIAVCALKMQEQGIVNLNTNIGTYWGDTLPKAVTLKSLLSHTSSLRALSYSSTRAGTLSQLTSSTSYTEYAVGSKWAYNNYAAGVAGSTLEVASGQTLNSYAKSNIFAPLGMDASFSSGLLNDTSKLATLYYSNDSVSRSIATSKGLVGSTTPGNNTSIFAGGLTCSAQDLAKMIAMLANDGKYNGVQVLSPDSVAAIESQLFTATEYGGSFSQCIPLRYKAGLYGESGLYYHTGNAYGVLALASYNPTSKNGVVVIATGMSDSNTNASCGRDSQGIYKICAQISEQMYRTIAAKGTTTTTTAPTTTTTTTTAPTTAPTAPSVPAGSISLSEQNISMKIGETRQLTAVLDPASATDALSWSSSGKCITVDSTGKITAVGYGSATVAVRGYSAQASCTVSVVPDVSIAILGASIRVSDPYGIRFGVQIKKNDAYSRLLSNSAIVEYGTLMIGAGNLGDNELTLDTQGIRRIEAVNLLSDDKSQLTYTGVIINIPQSFYDTNVTARGYFIYKDADGKQHIIYTDTVTKSFNGVAQAAYKAYISISSPTLEEQATLDKLAAILNK